MNVDTIPKIFFQTNKTNPPEHVPALILIYVFFIKIFTT